MNSEPLSESSPCSVKGSADRIASSAVRTPSWLLPSTARVSHPGGVNFRQIEGLDELPVGGVAGVGDQICLHEARGGDLPTIGLDRDVMFEQGTRLGPAVQAALELVLAGLQAAVDGGGTDQ